MKKGTENFLIESVLNGNQNDYAVLVDAHKDRVFVLVHRMVLNRELAEEIAQDAFLKAYQKLKSFKRNARFGTWVYQIAYRMALDALRKKKVYSQEVNEEIMGMEEEAANSDHQWVLDVLKKMDENDRALLHFYYFENQSVKEIAVLLGRTESAVKTALMRSRNRFKTYAEPWMSKIH